MPKNQPFGNFQSILNSPQIGTPNIGGQSQTPFASAPNYLGAIGSGINKLFSGAPAQAPSAQSFNSAFPAFGALNSMPTRTAAGLTFPAPSFSSSAAAPAPLISAPTTKTQAAQPSTPTTLATSNTVNTAANAGTVGGSPAVAPTIVDPQATVNKTYQTPNGGTVTVDANGQATNFQQAPGYSVDTNSTVGSNALNSNISYQNLASQRNQYADYLHGLAQAQMPNQDYLNALSQYKNAQTQGMQINADFLTNPQYPGDTYGFAQGVAGRQTALNAIQQQSAASSLAVQEAIRSGNIGAYQALVQGSAPQTLGYGQQLQSPLGGAPIATGQNQPSYSAVASPFGGYMVFNQRTGQYQSISADQLYGQNGGAGAGPGGAGGAASLPSFLQPALGNIAGSQYLDMSVITPAQIPYAQQVSAQTGIPLLSKDDVNKVQDAQTTYQSGIGLINNVAGLASTLITANNSAEAIAQAANLNIQSNIPGTQAKLYSDARNGFLSMITRAAGEKGTLAEGDVARIQAALPSFSDTKQTAATKIQTLSNIFQSAVEANISSRIGSKLHSTQSSGSSSGGTNANDLYNW